MFKTGDFLILGAAFVSFLFSVALWFGVAGPPNKEAGLFVGLWVPSILATRAVLRAPKRKAIGHGHHRLHGWRMRLTSRRRRIDIHGSRIQAV